MRNARRTMNNTQSGMLVAILAFILPFLPIVATAAPRMPMGFKVSFSNETGKTWCEIGSLPQPFAMARATLRSSMAGQGYKLVHDIAEGDAATRRLLFWRREDEDVILMIWQEDLYTTGVSWGISKRDDGFTSAEADERRGK